MQEEMGGPGQVIDAGGSHFPMEGHVFPEPQGIPPVRDRGPQGTVPDDIAMEIQALAPEVAQRLDGVQVALFRDEGGAHQDAQAAAGGGRGRRAEPDSLDRYGQAADLGLLLGHPSSTILFRITSPSTRIKAAASKSLR